MRIDWNNKDSFKRLLAAMVAAQDMKVCVSCRAVSSHAPSWLLKLEVHVKHSLAVHIQLSASRTRAPSPAVVFIRLNRYDRRWTALISFFGVQCTTSLHNLITVWFFTFDIHKWPMTSSSLLGLHPILSNRSFFSAAAYYSPNGTNFYLI